MPEEKIYHDSVILNAGHALIMPHKPQGIKMAQINDKLAEAPQDIQQFGLFDRATPNYTTYYPDVTPEDLEPKDAEFIEPVFRMLSNVTVHAQWNPIYFPTEVLKKSMYKMVGQSVNIDHEMAVGNAIGAVKSVEWQNSYTSNGVKVPAGFNAVLKIDGKSNPRIARGIMMDPPSIHSNSVTVNFAWKKSHPKMEDEEFFSKLGSFDDKGKLVQKIAIEVKSYHETSLVSHGADPFAQKVDDKGKIANPSYAADRYPLSEQTVNYSSWDWKQLEACEGNEVILNACTRTTIPDTINNNNIQNSEKMEDLLRFLETHFALEVDSLTEENVQEKLGVIDFKALTDAMAASEAPVVVLEIEGLEAIESEITSLREFKKTVPEDLADQVALAATGKTAVDELKADTIRLYRITAGEGKEDAAILAVIEGADYKTLQALHKQYDEATEGEFNFTCSECGSTHVTRASADPTLETKDPVSKSSKEVIDKFTEAEGKLMPWMTQSQDK